MIHGYYYYFILQKKVPEVQNVEQVFSLVEFMSLIFTCMPAESYCWWLRSLLLCLCDIFWALINSLVCWFHLRALWLILFQIVYVTQISRTHWLLTESTYCEGGSNLTQSRWWKFCTDMRNATECWNRCFFSCRLYFVVQCLFCSFLFLSGIKHVCWFLVLWIHAALPESLSPGT